MPSLLTILLLLSLIFPLSTFAQPIDIYLTDSKQSIKNGKFKTALIHLKNANKQYPKNITARLELSNLYLTLGQGALAQIEIKKALSLGATVSQTHVKLLKALLLQKQFKKVTAPIDNILDLSTSQIAQIRSLQGQAFLEPIKLKVFSSEHLP